MLHQFFSAGQAIEMLVSRKGSCAQRILTDLIHVNLDLGQNDTQKYACHFLQKFIHSSKIMTRTAPFLSF